MASGGARARSGPAPDPRSGRSDARGLKFEVLPVEGYSGPIPAFPLPEVEIVGVDSEGKRMVDFAASDARNLRERELWEQVWAYPQAVVWARESWRAYSVAQWVRTAVECESIRAKSADKTVLLRLAEQIGLTPAGLALNGWQIGAPEVEAAPADVKPVRRQTARDRVKFKVVDNGRASD